MSQSHYCSRCSDEAKGWTVRGSKRDRGKGIFFRSKRPDRLWGPHILLFNGCRSYFPEVNWRGREVGHSPPSGSDAKNEWRYTPASPTCLHDVGRDNFTVYFALTCPLSILVETFRLE
jgi:hypothetical protein